MLRMLRACSLVLLGVGLAVPWAAADSPAKADVARLEGELSHHRQRGEVYPALRAARKLLAAHNKRRGPTHPSTLRAMKEVSRLYAQLGDYDRATALAEKIVRRLQQTHGAEHVDTVSAIETLAHRYWEQRNYEHADRLYRRAIAIQKRRWGKSSDLYIGGLQRYAAFLVAAKRYSAAESHYAKARELLSAKLGANHPRVARSVWELGLLYYRQGDRPRARRAFDRVIRIYEKTADSAANWRLSEALWRIAYINQTWGNKSRANQLFDQVEAAYRGELRARQKAKRRDPSLIEHSRRKLAKLYQQRGQWDQAEAFYQALLAAAERSSGASDERSLSDRFALAEILQAQKKHRAAIKMLRRIERIYDKQRYRGWARGKLVAHLARVYRDMGKRSKARELGEQALKLALDVFGAGHPIVNQQREFLALVDLAQGNRERALAQLGRAYRAEKEHIALILAAGTDADNRSYLAQRAQQMDVAVALHNQYMRKSASALRLGLSMVLAHKGRLLDSAAKSMAPIRRRMSDKDQRLLAELSSARARLSKLVLAGPKATGKTKYRTELARLNHRMRKLERLIRKRSAAFRAKDRPIELSEVSKSIPAASALVEIVAYHRIDPRKGDTLRDGRMRYGAYILKRRGAPKWVDLGPAKVIDARVARFRKALSSPEREDASGWGRELYDLVFQPLQSAIGRSRHVLIAPDSALNLVPFAALVDRADNYLIRRYSFTYLTSGRELLRLGVAAPARDGVVIFADPEFGTSPRGKPKRKPGARFKSFSDLRWDRLPGTFGEAKAIAEKFRGARLLSGRRATERALKRLVAPRILHLATHGFFVPEPGGQIAIEDHGSAAFADDLSSDIGPANPLLRSGLALAGANRLSSGREDGVLTALEASGLDLWGTSLVVLSACETGVGKTRAGQGVYGLRRAFALAGAESLVMSLWQVDDQATRRLMTGYYDRLDNRRGRGDALRAQQLALLESDAYSHPYYWAGFIPSGQWAPLPSE